MITEDYFQNVIKKSWTWARLTEEERQRFVDMNVFDKIKGNEKNRIEWLNMVYSAYLAGLGVERKSRDIVLMYKHIV